MSFNKITIVGNLGRDPELRYTPQGNAVCNFSVATNEKRRDKNGEMQDITTWFRITLWGKQAENASKYLTKGSPIYVEGRLKVEEWTDRDGKGRYTLEVSATDMQFISAGARGDEMSGGGGGGMDETGFGGDDSREMMKSSAAPTDDDIPF
jgi:single-strand DNA-binding protein